VVLSSARHTHDAKNPTSAIEGTPALKAGPAIVFFSALACPLDLVEGYRGTRGPSLKGSCWTRMTQPATLRRFGGKKVNRLESELGVVIKLIMMLRSRSGSWRHSRSEPLVTHV
jgi:hypothetical protein